jgi:uncharacterized protein with HEPN domain
LYLHHVLECIERVEQYTEGKQELFLNDMKTHDAVLRNLQILSESTQRLPQAWKDEYPFIPWQQIGGFRNRLVHEYLGVKPELVWQAIERDLPILKEAI